MKAAGQTLKVKIDPLPNGTIKVSQLHLIQSVLDDLKFNGRMGMKKTPASPIVKLNRDIHGEPFNEDLHYRGVIGKLNLIKKLTGKVLWDWVREKGFNGSNTRKQRSRNRSGNKPGEK